MDIKHRKKIRVEHRISGRKLDYLKHGNECISAETEQNKYANLWFKKGLILIFCFLIAICNYYHVSYMQESHLTFSHLSTMEREMSFRTEMGFYYSFFKQVIEAPSLKASIYLLTRDNLTEYPLTINALQRFNVYPEFVVGLMYRFYIWICDLYQVETRICYTVNRDNLPAVTSCEGLGEPAIFYVHIVVLLNSFMLPFLFLIAYHVSGGSIVGGLISTLLYFYNHRECTRVQWTPPLRESFSYPFLLMQQYFLLKMLSPIRASKWIQCGYAASTIAALLCWQFAQFSMLTHCIAVFLAYVVAGDTRTKSATQRVFILLLIADLVNLVLQFGNTLLLVGPLRPCVVIAFILVTLEPASLHARFHNSCLAPLRWLLLTLTLLSSTLALKILTAHILNIKSDDHMFEILKSKFSDFKSFDSLLYTCAPEFDFYDISSLLELAYTGLLPICCFVVVLLVLYTLMKWFQLCCAYTRVESELNFLVQSGLCDIGTYFLFFQTVAYTLMALVIMRLKLFMTPQWCIVASMVCHGRWWPRPLSWVEARVSSERWSLVRRVVGWWLLVALVALCSVKGVGNLRAEWAIRGSYMNWEQEQLLGAVMKMSGRGDSFAGQMATMATVRLVTGRPVTMHPHYEDEGLRARVHKAYSVYSRQSVRQVWLEIRSSLEAGWLVYEQGYCVLVGAGRGGGPPRPGCTYNDMWDLADPGSRLQGHAPLCVAINDHIAAMRHGHTKMTSAAAQVGTFFRWRFTSDGGAYSLLQVLPVPLA